MNEYLPYSCKCCGYANGDMFYDYFKNLGRDATEKESALFDGYTKAWRMLHNERLKAKSHQFYRIPNKMSEKTKRKISATKKGL